MGSHHQPPDPLSGALHIALFPKCTIIPVPSVGFLYRLTPTMTMQYVYFSLQTFTVIIGSIVILVVLQFGAVEHEYVLHFLDLHRQKTFPLIIR